MSETGDYFYGIINGYIRCFILFFIFSALANVVFRACDVLNTTVSKALVNVDNVYRRRTIMCVLNRVIMPVLF